MDLNLAGKKVIVTGGSKGIGAATVKAFLEEGAQVAFCARGLEGIQAFEKELEAMQGAKGQAFGLPCDVSNPADFAKFFEQAISRLGGLDVFVANVSGGAHGGEEGWLSAFNTDIMATVRGCDLALPHLAQAGGAITVVASIAATHVLGNPGPYGAAKAALVNYASQLGDVAARHGVRVNCVSPGPIYVKDGFWGQLEHDNPQAVEQVKAQHPMGRLGETEEVAKPIVYLSSSAASWVNRCNMIIDGGFSRSIQF